jgi:hypothetical protein
VLVAAVAFALVAATFVGGVFVALLPLLLLLQAVPARDSISPAISRNRIKRRMSSPPNSFPKVFAKVRPG